MKAMVMRALGGQTLIFFLLLLQALPATAPAQTPSPPFWKITSDSGTAWLLGSIHFGRPELYPLPARVTDAFAKADALVVEIDVRALDLGAGAQTLLLNGIYTDGTTLREHVGADTWRALSAAVEALGFSIQLFLPQKPWLAALTLTALELQRVGYHEEYGVDRHFLHRAGTDKPVIELETMAEQLGVFEALTEREQEAFLQETLRELKQGAAYLDALVGAWQSGDSGRLHAMLGDSFRARPETRRLYQLLFTERNRRMVHRLEALLAQGGTVFVVVGAGHLTGEGGLVGLLRERGYRVERR